MLFSLLFQFSLSGYVAEYCIYQKDSKKCSGHGNNATFAASQYEKSIKNISSETNKFDFYDEVTVNVAEDISGTKIDIYLLKNAKNIRVIGLDENQQFGFGLEATKIATLDAVEIRNAHCIKDDTTQFYITNLTLHNIQFTGFEKASCFYGSKLDIDFLSPSNTTFKFEEVIYRCNYTKEFNPNYDVDGAIWRLVHSGELAWAIDLARATAVVNTRKANLSSLKYSMENMKRELSNLIPELNGKE